MWDCKDWFNHWHKIAKLVEHLTRDSWSMCLNPGLDCHYFSLPNTFGAMPIPGTDR